MAQNKKNSEESEKNSSFVQQSHFNKDAKRNFTNYSALLIEIMDPDIVSKSWPEKWRTLL